ncbi:dihydrofolate reductase family protein [Streptomyces sp. F63]|uniref:dihydrofolate reductase family protein n=1 Tax=Streptomyces sp. F63 TaxID=2824887 RepID=UPI001B384507|nr:dihydrofolate reductase family protein [Streptomyces sp. F63]MBQ0986603.1 dihydrofolate reductase family protein [Streptomyces sp. F63]
MTGQGTDADRPHAGTGRGSRAGTDAAADAAADAPAAGTAAGTTAPASAPVGARPRVITHNSGSVDGRIALSPGLLLMTDERWPVHAGSGYRNVKQRHHPQAILEGSGSFITDDHSPEPLPPATEPADVLRRDHLPAPALEAAATGWLVVPDSRGRVRWVHKQFPGPDWEGWHLLVLVTAATPLPYLSFLRSEGIPYLVVAGDGTADLSEALARLRDVLGVETVVSTGGGRLNGALLRAGVVDEIEVEVVPIAVGGTTTPALFTAPDLAADAEATPLRLLAVEQRPRDRVLLRYEVVHP